MSTADVSCAKHQRRNCYDYECQRAIRENRCAAHGRPNCYVYECSKISQKRTRQSKAGQLGINSEGNPALGLGGGMSIDITDGSLGLGLGGSFSIDMG